MKRCPYCQAELEASEQPICPDCHRPLDVSVSGGSSLETVREDMRDWPLLPDGTPEEAAILATVPDGLMGEATLGLLRAFEIPFMLEYPLFGRLTRVYVGLSMAGVDVYVPKSQIDRAVELLTSSPDISDEDIGLPEDSD